MTINYGKRAAGALTASSPGDTLYIPFATYNDSGASIGINGTLAVTDIEIFKNGDVTPRATDSGYSLLTDTGQYGDRLGLHRIKIQIYNTADDTGFFDAGSQYHVAIDAITVDARPVRFFPAVFEVGTPLADVIKIDGDTGGADRFGKLAALQLKTDGTFDTGTGQAVNTFNVTATATTDTGQVNNAVWNGLRSAHTAAGSFGQYVIADVDLMNGDTGAADVLQKFADTTGALSPSGELDTGSGSPVADTGWVSRAVWDSIRSAHTAAGSFGQYVIADADLVDGDTGAADVLQKFADTTGALSPSGELDTGSVANSSYLPANVTRWLGTAAATPTVAGVPKTETVSFADTGVNDRLAKIQADTDTGIQSSVTVTLLSDTGSVSNAVWNSLRSAHAAAGAFGEYVFADVTRIDGDTGSADVLAKATNGLGGVSFSAGINMNSSSDTGINDRLAKILADTDTGIQSSVNVTSFADTGVNDRLGRILADTDTGIQSSVNITQIRGDTGAADRWLKLAGSQLKTDGTFDTGTGQTVNTFNITATATTDTGQVSNAVWNSLRSAHTVAGSFGESDTGINNRLSVIAADTDTGIQSSVTVTLLSDTGSVSNAVWNSLRASHVAAGSFGQYVIADVDLMDGDTGAADVLQKFADTTGALSPSGELDTGSGSPIADTGWVSRAVWDSRRADHTSSATFGNYIFADMQFVDGDTGAANVLSKFAGTAGALNPDGDLDTGSVANSSYLPANVIRWLGTAAATPTVAGVPKTEVVSFADTGVNGRLTTIQTKTDGLTFTVAGVVDSNIQRVNDVLIVGTGDTGLADTWRPSP